MSISVSGGQRILTAIGAFALPVLLGMSGCGRKVAPAVLTNTAQVRHLSEAQLRSHVPVRITGIITYADRLSSYCFIQDATGGIRVGLAAGQFWPAAGYKVEAEGVAVSADPAPGIDGAVITPLREETQPADLPVTEANLRDPAYEYRRVATSGVVHSISSERPGLVSIEIALSKDTISALIPVPGALFDDSWLDAEVSASGVLAEPLDHTGRDRATLWIFDARGIRITRPAPLPATLPVREIRTLASSRGGCPVHRVRVRGAPSVAPPGELAVIDAGGQMRVRLRHAALDPNTNTLDLAGFLAWENGQPILEQAIAMTAKAPIEVRAPGPGFTLTTARAVHELPNELAERAYPVRLDAVVTYFDRINHLLFVQDATDGIFVQLQRIEDVALRAGDRIEIKGVTAADFAPDVAGAEVKVVGHPGLPDAKQGSFGYANWGREDCHWLELPATVQNVAPGESDTLLTLSWGKNIYKAHVLAQAASLAQLVDAEVILRGVCGALFNRKRQMLGIQMFVPGAEFIRVVRPPAGNLFAATPTSIAELLQYSPAHDMAHRVRIQGTVTYPSRSGPTWVRDSTGGVMIRDHEATQLAVGDLVDVVGFPEILGFGPVLRGSRIQRLRSGKPPVPVRISADEALKGDYNGQLLEIEGLLIDRLQQPAEQVLAVKSGETIFNAKISGEGKPGLVPGTYLRLTGICSVETEQAQDLILPRAFGLLLRSPADLDIIGRPPLLTAGRVVPALSAAMLLIAAALAWAALLRRRVRTQTFALRAQTVQLQAAHQRTRDALRKACEAEALDLDSKRILELIARDEPVELILDLLAEAVALHYEGAACAILVGEPHGARLCVVPAMPAAWMEALRQVDIAAVACGPEFREIARFSHDPAWRAFLETQPKPRFQMCTCAPIIVDGTTAGVIAAFLRTERSESAEPGVQLDLWSNIAALALERRRLHDQLAYRAQYDSLTGLPNRMKLYETLEAEIARAARSGGILGLLYIDLDGFKKINDTCGHDAGDTVLREAARRMTQAVRRGDMVARIGGDEFIVLLPFLSRREDAEQVAEKIAEAIREPIHSGHQRFSVCASVGTAIWPVDGDKADPLLRFADAQMYGEKRRRWYERTAVPPGGPDRVEKDALSRPEEALVESVPPHERAN